MAIFSMSTTKLVLSHLVPNCLQLKRPLPNDLLHQPVHEPMLSPTDRTMHAQAMARDQTVRHHGDETTIAERT
jgi:hypothetical protein